VHVTLRRPRAELEGETSWRRDAQHHAHVGRCERREQSSTAVAHVRRQLPGLTAHDRIASHDKHVFLDSRRVHSLTQVGTVRVYPAFVGVRHCVEVNEDTRGVADTLRQTRLTSLTHRALDATR
jgi:hypothetical protein